MEQQSKRQQPDNPDLEFKKILCTIRQHIPYINSNAYLMQCRVWLEKLSSSNVNKVLRNLYLVELCKQIQANKLLPPFNAAPPSGDLKRLTRFIDGGPCGIQSRTNTYDEPRISSTKNTPINTKEAKRNPSSLINASNWDYVEPLKSDEEIQEASLCIKKFKKQKRCTSLKDTKEKNSFTLAETERNNNMCCGEPVINRSETEISLNTTKSKEIAIDDEDSWSDLTDGSYGSEYKPVVNTKEVLNVKVKKNRKVDSEEFDVDNICKTDPENVSDKNTQQEKCMANRSDIQPDPNLRFPNDTDYIAQDWKKTIAALQLRLSEMIQQNNELNAVIQKLELKLEDNKIKNIAQYDHNMKMAENLHSQELTKLKEVHAENILELEKSFEENIENLGKDYEEKMKELSYSYEQQIADLKKQNEEVLNKKDIEICRLSEIIQDQCLRIMNDISTLKTQISSCTCDKKVHVLKKCVSRMDKLFQKSEKEYIKKIEQLKQELELKENALQMQLKIQKAELIAQTRTGQKEEFEEILNALEVKYIKMLEGHEHQIMKMKKQDDEKIRYLSELLEKNGICYNDKIDYGDKW